MSVVDYEKLEFRVCLIGDEFIGKKTILSRFRTLKCTETLEFKNILVLKTKKNEKLRGKPCDKPEIPIEVSKMKQKIDNVTNFTKIFRIDKNLIEFNFFVIPPAEKIGFSDNLNEEDEVEKLHKMKFENIKNSFKNIFSKPSKNNLEIKYLLLFMFDITNNESLDRIKIYYDEINKNINFDENPENFYKILVGNKIDLKIPYETINRDNLLQFMTCKSIRYFETSGKMFFNFEKFFEKMFFDLFEKKFPIFELEYFKNKFINLLTIHKTIPLQTKEDKSALKDIPGPEKYKNNVYDITENPGKDFLFKIRF